MQSISQWIFRNLKIWITLCGSLALIESKTFAADENPTHNDLPKTNQQDVLSKSFYFHGLFSPLDMLIPNKLGFNLGVYTSPERGWELEYLKGSIGAKIGIPAIGEMSDTRISLIRRSYNSNNSFNLSYGLSFFDFNLHLGDELMSRLTGSYPSVDLIRVQSLGVNIGFGNRWNIYKNTSLGIDWVSLAQPLITLKKESSYLDYATSSQDKDDVNTALNVVSFVPRLVLFKIQLGVSF